ncbi:MAG: redoxin domain-containing protein [Deltaproteobacteria bacterium]|nr:redoxin domain-containing protein [Deltaproteobacteria bacterium]
MELPDVESQIWRKYRDRGVLVFGIHSGEDPKLLADFIQQTGVTFPVTEDVGDTLFRLRFPRGVGYPYPRDVVIGKDGTIRLIANAFDVAEMDALLQRLINE